MPSITTKTVPDEVPPGVPPHAARVKLGTLLTEIGEQAGGVDLDPQRDDSPAEPMSFEGADRAHPTR
ncbi:hypothetical protein N825_21205 [Skermanella stibiiresistens SB22]|uniref:Uncharacterized protein n=1 Tax=Skermanella stibiiresistens SB22 TaxID=1385369 RepID=W9GTN6_9PROT|nr:hypothetical protein [Skermanella stibiiresistens]EWY37250.1 hypothetical protein N825_21205 [Skermanella stibiiresistens SB22]